MSKARDNANNWAADITAVSAGVGVTGGGTSGAVTVTNDMATTIDAKGDLVVGTGADTYTRVPVGSNNQVLTADSATTSGVKWATADALPSQTGNSGKYLTTNGTTASWGTINQPITWTERRSGTASTDIYRMEYNGSLIVAVGGSGLLLTSTDGITWTSRTSNFGTSTIHAIAFGNGLWVAVGGAGKIATSTDGITWTLRTSNMGTNTIYDVKYANGVWVAVGDGGGTTNTGGITYSSDGITWTRKSQSIAIGTGYYTVNWNGTNWLVGADLATNNIIYASTPSGTWTGVNFGSINITDLIYDGTRTIVLRSSGGIYYSTSATLSTINSYNGAEAIQNAGGQQQTHYYNGNIYRVGPIVNYYSSTPINTDFVQGMKNLGFSPTAQAPNSGSTINFGEVGILPCSLGIIVWASYGRIYTSF